MRKGRSTERKVQKKRKRRKKKGGFERPSMLLRFTTTTKTTTKNLSLQLDDGVTPTHQPTAPPMLTHQPSELREVVRGGGWCEVANWRGRWEAWPGGKALGW